MGRFIRCCVMLAALAVLAGCGKGEAETPPYPILDSGFPASTNDRLYWLDNDRVIFVSYGPKPKSLEEAQKHPRVPSINIWDTRTNKVTVYKNSAKGLCADGGYIQYAIAKVPYDPEYQPKWYAGQIGQEQEISLPPGRLDNSVILNPHTCRWQERPGYAKRKMVIPLREGDGWLVSDDAAQEWVWHQADGEAVQTGIPYWVHTAQWMQFAGGYFLKDTVDGRKRAQIDCHQFWWVMPKNKINKGCQDIRPFKQWKGSGTSLLPARVGILVEPSGDYKKGQTGFFLESENQVIRVIKGAEVVRVSLDGCRMAYVSINHQGGPMEAGPEEVSLKVVNLCNTN